jgi:fumarate hydratase subunit alpha
MDFQQVDPRHSRLEINTPIRTGGFRLISKEKLTEVIVDLLKKASIRLPRSVKEELQNALRREEEEVTRHQLETILENISIAEDREIPVCQDTGVPIFFVKVGRNCSDSREVAAAITEGTVKATKTIPLRENVIHPLTKENSGTNTGWRMPFIYYEMSPEDFTEIQVLLKGFGSEAKTSLAYIPTSEDVIKGTLKFVLDCVRKGFGEPCPPYILGVGMGGTSDIAALLAKKAFLRLPLGKKNPDPAAAELEERLLAAVNATGIGAMGMGGKTTALAVHVELCGTHSAAVPVAVAIQCWADRQAAVRIHSNGTSEFLEERKNG